MVNRPRKTGDRCIVADKPWEGHRVGAYTTVMDDGGILKMWYDAIANDGSHWLCYATSQNGIHWKKPELGIVPFGGVEKTNIVFPLKRESFEPGCIFRDANPNCPSGQRYKLVCSYNQPWKEAGVWVFASPDGIHWRPIVHGLSFRPSDTGNICFFDDRVGRYVAYVRV